MLISIWRIWSVWRLRQWNLMPSKFVMKWQTELMVLLHQMVTWKSMKAYVTCEIEFFFWNSKYLKHYIAHKDQNKMIVTGINLINKKLDWYLLCNKNRVTHRVTEKQLSKRTFWLVRFLLAIAMDWSSLQWNSRTLFKPLHCRI